MTNRHIFRMTYYRNIRLFLSDGAEYAKNHRQARRCFRTSYTQIVNRRGTEFWTPDHENINDFVPFYFSPVTSMAYTIHKGNVPLLTPEGQADGYASSGDLAFIVCNTDRIGQSELDFWFTDIACNSAFAPNFENNLSNLDSHIDWSLFDETKGKAKIPEIGYNGVHWDFRSLDEPAKYKNRHRKRMAEFMVKDFLPFDLVDCIVVQNHDIKSHIDTWIAESAFEIQVYVKPGCYF